MAVDEKQKYRSWTDEEDHLLKESVLEKVRNGKTQQEGFLSVSEATDRTVGSVAFRWNNKLRKEFSADLKKAKAEFKNGKSEQPSDTTKPTSSKKTNKKEKNIQVLVDIPVQQNDKKPSTITVGYDDVIEFINEKRAIEAKFEELSESYEALIAEHNNLKQNFDEVVAVVTKIKAN